MPRWVKLWDGAFENALAEPRRPRTKWEAWLDVFANLAQWQPYKHLTKYGLVELDRGEFLASRNYLADRWGWGAQAVRGYLDLLQSEGQIATKRITNAGTVYCVVNYERYQGATDASNQDGNPLATNLQPTSNQPATIEEEYKELEEPKEYKKKTTRAAAKKNGHATWLTPYGDDYQVVYGLDSDPPWARMAAALKPKHDSMGDALRSAHQAYLLDTEARFYSPQRFVQTLGRYTGQALDTRSVESRSQMNLEGWNPHEVTT